MESQKFSKINIIAWLKFSGKLLDRGSEHEGVNSEKGSGWSRRRGNEFKCEISYFPKLDRFDEINIEN